MGADAEREFREFVAARSAALFRSAYLLTGQREAAEDLLQTVLARVARRWRRIDGAPEAYVRRALYREQVSRWRRSGRSTVLPAAWAWHWYGDDALLSLTFNAAGDTLARITAVDGRRVVNARALERNPDLR